MGMSCAMSHATDRFTPTDTTGDLWAWWRTLTEDQRDLLRITASTLPLSRHVLDLLAWSGCPSVDLAEDGRTGVIREPGRLTAFVAHA